MPADPLNFGSLLSAASAFAEARRPMFAQVQQAVILMKQTDVALTRNGVTLDPQTVRLELEDTYVNANSEVGVGNLKKGTLHGIHGHPDLDDTDIEVWDTFRFQDMEFTITFVNRFNEGQVQADFEVIG